LKLTQNGGGDAAGLFPGMHAAAQADALRVLLSISTPGGGDGPAAGLRGDQLRRSGGDKRDRAGDQVPLEAGEAAPGALAASYFIPEATYHPWRSWIVIPLTMLAVAIIAVRHFLAGNLIYLPILPFWLLAWREWLPVDHLLVGPPGEDHYQARPGVP
jgi:hypothetical protein